MVFLFVALGACSERTTGGDRGQVLGVSVAGSADRMIVVHSDQQLRAEVETRGGASRAVRWLSSDDEVVRVDAAGRVRALRLGEATVTAVSLGDDTVRASVRFRVIDALPRTTELGLMTSDVGALVGGRPVPVSWRVSSDGTGLMNFAAVSVRLSFPRRVLSSDLGAVSGAGAGLNVSAGRTINVAGQGYRPGSLVGFWLIAGDAELWLDSALVTEEGSFAVTVTIPAEVPEGPYALLWTGVDPAGESLASALNVFVSAPAEGEEEPAPSEPFEARIVPAMPELVVGGSVAFAVVADVSSTDVTWRLREGNCGTIDAAGGYTAPALPARCTVVVRLIAGAGVAEAQTTVTVVAEPAVATPLSIHLLPSASSVPVEGSVTLAAIVPGGDAGGVVWSSSCGRIVGEGYLVSFQAPAMVGACVVTAARADAPGVSQQLTLAVAAGGSGTGARFAQLSVFYEHVLALDAAGRAWGWGPNHNDQLGTGNGPFAANPTAVQMPAGSRFLAVAAGGGHSLALDQHGRAWGWGWNGTGEVGRGNNQWTDRPTAAVMPAGVTFVALAAGASHSLALDHRGRLWAWGNSEFGQLGDGEQQWRAAPVRVEAPPEVVFTAISAGWLHSVALDKEGRIWTWGHNNGSQGRLGDGGGGDRSSPVALVLPGNPTFVAIAAGADHTVALDATGNAWSWGAGLHGDGSAVPRFVPTPVTMPAGVRFRTVAGGLEHSLAVDTEGRLWAWGENGRGALGLGDDTRRLVPTAVPWSGSAAVSLAAGTGNSFALETTGEAWSWGFNGDAWSRWEDRSGLLGRGRGPDQFTPRPIATSLPQVVTGLALVAGADGSAPVNGLVPVPPVVRVVGEGGQPLVGVEVRFERLGGDGALVPSNGLVLSDANGLAALAGWRLGTRAGEQSLRVSVPGRQLQLSALALPGEASLGNSTLRIEPSVIAAGGVDSATITLQLKDSYDNDLLGDEASVTFERQPAVGAFGEVMALGEGAYAVIFTAPVDPVTLRVSARWNGLPIDRTLTVEVVPNGTAAFFLDPNGVTVRCPFAAVGDQGVVGGLTYTKRTREQITAANAASTCTSGITDMNHLFADQPSFDGDISSWDTGAVTSMEAMFVNGHAFNADIRHWNVSNVADMRSMFYGARTFNQPIGGWETGNLLDMRAMFALATAFDQDIGDWDVSRVRDLGWVFYGASAFNQDIGRWDTHEVTGMHATFLEASSFHQNLGGWNTGSVRDMRSMFERTARFNGDIGGWDTSSVKEMDFMFFDARSFNRDLSGWCVSGIESFSMFDAATPSWALARPQWGSCPAR